MSSNPASLTGTWMANDGGMYFLRQIEAPKPPDSATRRSWLSPAGRSVSVPRLDVAPRGTSDHSPVTADPLTEA